MKVPIDIVNAINSKLEEESKLELIGLCEDIYKVNINVGYEQLIRSMLILSNFNIKSFLELRASNFCGDPRDLIMKAQAIDNSFNYGMNKFK